MLTFADMQMQSTHTYDCRARKIRCCLPSMLSTAAECFSPCSDQFQLGNDRLGTQNSLGSETFDVVQDYRCS